MAKPELTKQLIAQTLKKLMTHIPLDKISVRDIVESCEINRKTFYYHFHDKQALICWIFDNEFANLSDLNQDSTIIDELVQHLYDNKDFYIAALTSDVQNNLREHLFEIAYNTIIKRIAAIIGTRVMPHSEISMIANYFSNALIGCIAQWAREGMKTPPNEYNFIFYPMTQECLEFVIEKYFRN